jgi:cullin 4
MRYIVAKGESMLMDEELAKKESKAIEDFIEFRQSSVELVKKVFSGPQQTNFLKNAVHEGFSVFLNKEGPEFVAEHLAKYLDFHLRKVSGQAGISDETLIQIIDEVLILFKLCRAKDTFEEFYQRGLCRRLLLNKSASYESEKMMIIKLKTECSDTFIQRAEGMLKDLTLSDDIMKKYLECTGMNVANKFEGVEGVYHVLSQASWPI